MLKVTLEEARTALGLPVVDEDGTTIDFPARALTLHEGEVFDGVDDALVCAFDWGASPEGAEFWTEVWNNALAWIHEPANPGKAHNAAWLVRQAKLELLDAGFEGMDGFSAIVSSLACLEDDIKSLALVAEQQGD
jgi:hypothetical protein